MCAETLRETTHHTGLSLVGAEATQPVPECKSPYRLKERNCLRKLRLLRSSEKCKRASCLQLDPYLISKSVCPSVVTDWDLEVISRVSKRMRERLSSECQIDLAAVEDSGCFKRSRVPCYRRDRPRAPHRKEYDLQRHVFFSSAEDHEEVFWSCEESDQKAPTCPVSHIGNLVVTLDSSESTFEVISSKRWVDNQSESLEQQ